MQKDIGRVLLALSLSTLLLACGKDDGKDKSATDPTAATPHPAPVAEAPGHENPGGENAAAGNEGAPGTAAPPSGVVPKVEELADKACGCVNKPCADGVQDELAKLMAEMKDVQANERQPIANAMQKLQKCLANAQR